MPERVNTPARIKQPASPVATTRRVVRRRGIARARKERVDIAVAYD